MFKKNEEEKINPTDLVYVFVLLERKMEAYLAG